MTRLEISKYRNITIYHDNKNKSTSEFGNCPDCYSPNNKIQWGWHGVYYDMICENGHQWKYNFS